jgi:hypothetical protein
MRVKLAGLAVVALVQTACFAVTEKNWEDRYAKNRCQFAKSCEKATFYFNYADMDECVGHQIKLYNERDDHAGCTFDKKMAKDCVSALNSRCKVAGADYESLFAACYEVWDCGADPIDTAE